MEICSCIRRAQFKLFRGNTSYFNLSQSSLPGKHEANKTFQNKLRSNKGRKRSETKKKKQNMWRKANSNFVDENRSIKLHRKMSCVRVWVCECGRQAARPYDADTQLKDGKEEKYHKIKTKYRQANNLPLYFISLSPDWEQFIWMAAFFPPLVRFVYVWVCAVRCKAPHFKWYSFSKTFCEGQSGLLTALQTAARRNYFSLH